MLSLRRDSLIAVITDRILIAGYHALPHYVHTRSTPVGSTTSLDRCSRPDLLATWACIHSWDTVHSRLTPGISAIL